VLGADPWSDVETLHRRLAYVPGDVTLWPNLTGGEVIDFLGRLRGGLDRAKRDDLLERFDLDPTKKGRAYSKGNRQKVALVAALASDVDLLLLDEPTAGLDPLMERVFRDCIDEVRAQGRTVLLSSHILSEVEALCDRVSIIKDGRTVESGSLAHLRHLTRTSLSTVLEHPPTAADLATPHRLARRRHRGRPAHRVGRHRTHRAGPGGAGGARHTGSHLSGTHPGGAVPAQLPVMSAYSGTGALLRLAWRRDRVLVPLGILGHRRHRGEQRQGHPRALPHRRVDGRGDRRDLRLPCGGRPLRPDGQPHQPDSLAVVKMTMMGAVFLSLFGYAVVRRHTRSEEEAGRLELLGSGVVGRRPP
jgi:hypothetical protein